jgi:sugar/nucleoside kinase (ribokinase family)
VKIRSVKKVTFSGIKCVVYNLGSKGKIIVSEKERSLAKVHNVQIVDTVGAGNSFTVQKYLKYLKM